MQHGLSCPPTEGPLLRLGSAGQCHNPRAYNQNRGYCRPPWPEDPAAPGRNEVLNCCRHPKGGRKAERAGRSYDPREEDAVECVGPQVVYITVLRLKPFIGNVDLGVALAPCGRVLGISLPTFKGLTHVESGHRLVRMEMVRPVPNFPSVRGARVQCEYRGVKRVCSRCDQQGHNGKECVTPWCARCQSFGHDTDTCSEPCRRCSGNHATAD